MYATLSKTLTKDVIGYDDILLIFLVKVFERSRPCQKMLYDKYSYPFYISSQGLWEVARGLKKIVHHKSFFENKNKIIKI